MSEEASDLEEVTFRYPRLTLIVYPRWDRVVLLPFGNMPVSVTVAECLAAIRRAKEAKANE